MNKDFLDIYEKLSKLNEKWYTGEDPSYEKIWYSDSIYEFRNFIQNVVNEGKIKGLRLCISNGHYLAARASDLNHDVMREVLYETTGIRMTWKDSEGSIIGIPKAENFESDNYEIPDLLEDDPDYDIYKEYSGKVIADCGNFEVYLIRRKSETDWKGTATEEAFRPFIKGYYIHK